MGACSPKFYGLPKVHKRTPPEPTVLSRDSVTYGVARVIAHTLFRQVPAPHTQHIALYRKKFWTPLLEPVESIISYDIMALFTSVLVAPAVKIV